MTTNICIVKAMVFPVIMYGCESWTIKDESWIIDAFELQCWRRFLSVPLDSKEIKPVNPKGNQSWIFIGRTDAADEAPILWPLDVKGRLIEKDPDAGTLMQEKETTEDEVIGWHHQFNGHEFEQTLGGSEGQRSLACCSPWSLKESDKVERLNENNKHTNSSLMGQCSVCLSKQVQCAYLSLCCPICIQCSWYPRAQNSRDSQSVGAQCNSA